MSACCLKWQVFVLHWLYLNNLRNLGFYLKTACILLEFISTKFSHAFGITNISLLLFITILTVWQFFKTVTFLSIVRLYVSLSKWIPLCCYGWTRLETTTQVLARGSSVGAGLTIARTLTLKKLLKTYLPPIHRANVLHRQREKRVLPRYRLQILVPSPRTRWSLPQVQCPLI